MTEYAYRRYDAGEAGQWSVTCTTPDGVTGHKMFTRHESTAAIIAEVLNRDQAVAGETTGDGSWAATARSARLALRLLGYNSPDCLPDEPEACGGSFAQHAMAQLAALKAVADHQLGHLGELGQDHGRIYWDVRGKVEGNCVTHHEGAR